MSNSELSCVAIDDSFGPYAGHCRGGFDFTLFFEDTILSIAPLSMLLLMTPFRILYLWRKETKVSRSLLLPAKLLTWSFLAAFDLALLILWAKPSTYKSSASVASAALSFSGALLLPVLSYFEHQRTVRTSFLLNVYLLLTVVLDAARSRTYSIHTELELVSVLFTTRVGVKLFLAIFEARGKSSLLLSDFAKAPPESVSGVYSRALFWWQNSLFRLGFSKTLSVDDLFYLDKHLTADYLQRRIQSGWHDLTRKGSNSLLVVTLRRLKWSILAVVPPRLCLIAFNFCQPFLIDRAIRYSEQAESVSRGAQTENIGYGLIAAYALVYVGIAISTGQYQHLTYRFITMMRGGLISMLYTKTTDIILVDADPASSLTLMSADIERIVTGLQTAHELWSNTLEVILAIYLLGRELGAACAVPIAVAVFSLAGSLGATRLVMKRQAMWLEAIERRIAATAAMLGSMKGVKMSGLTDVLRDDLQQLRIDELEISKKFRKLLIWTMGFSYISPVASPILTFAVFSVMAQNKGGTSTLDTAKVFTSLSLFSLLTEPLGSLIMALAGFMGAVGSFRRIQSFLSKDSLVEKRHIPGRFGSASDIGSYESEKGSNDSQKSHLSLGIAGLHTGSEAIVMEKGFFGWDKKESQGWLQNVDLTVPRAKITMVVGPVGCGKSSLLKAMLGELPVMRGTVYLSSTRIAFCDQTPWHMNGTVQQAIVGISDFERKWYSSVIRSTALDEDLRQLPQGDQTQIGNRGIALSGGQSQRIALARAVYSQKDIIILDDCLSGLDSETENRVWQSLFGRTGLLRRCRTTVLLASSSAKRLPYCDHIIALDQSGRIIEQGSYEKLSGMGGYVSNFDLPPPDWDYSPEKHVYEAPPKYTERATNEKVREDDILAEANRRTGDSAIYLFYIRSVGWVPTMIFVMSITIFIFGQLFPTWWVKEWASFNDDHPNQKLGLYLGVYGMLGGVALLFLVVSCWQLIITMVPRSGVHFHWTLLTTVLRSPMTFFSTTDTGVTLNRFSQDLQLIDMELPVSALNTFATFVLCIGQMVLIGVSSPYAAISFPIVGLSLYTIQKFYLRTSRQLRFLDLEAKSPLYTQFNEMLEGLATIRAFGWQDFLVEKAKALLDRSQRPFYLLFAVQRWLTLVLDLVVAAVAILLITLVVTLRGKIQPGYVGVALLNVILFSQSVKLLVSFWAQLETQIGSVARVKNFTTDAISEDLEGEDLTPPPSWPTNGKVEFKDITACYRPHEPVVEKFSLTIEPGEKLAIVGRTGSGKSSLVLTLFRMLDLSAGSICIDSIPLHRLPRQTIRSHLIGLPQDAYLLPGSIRRNADPLKQSTDKSIIQALKDVRLWDIVISKGDERKYAHPLDVEVEDLHFSHGQKQLFCLARAILRREKSTIVVLDEATSSLDNASDSHVQKMIRSNFTAHTVIAVAHKLETILDFDRVAVMHNGKLVECGEPSCLLETEGSWFKSLYEDSSRMEDGENAEDL